jgi:hypothetical protein
MSAFAFAETYVFGKQSVEPLFCSLLTPRDLRKKLLRHPFFRRYGVILPSSLTEGRSITLGCFSLPTCVGLRYGRKRISLEAFLGGLGTGDFRTLTGTRCHSHVFVTGICLDDTLDVTRPACPFAGFTFPTASPLH